ncbi:MAG TPA: hypothetical protein VMZ06_05645 [Candidatus Bathyarchaeia archaeon]|nr:hypothetical protein [Candidatus Bathyarchaeia archaeon]
MTRYRAGALALTGLLLATAVQGAAEERDVRSWADRNRWRALQSVVRKVPVPARDHPGNVFLQGETVVAPIPGDLSRPAVRWRVLDDRLGVVADGPVESGAGRVALGMLDIGWYRVEFLGADGEPISWTCAAVLARLAEPVPQDSPIGIDGALSWYPTDTPEMREHLARLAALAGVNWIRDRLRWREIQPEQDTFAKDTVYDAMAVAQSDCGLKVLQVFHGTPQWATAPWAVRGAAESPEATGRFPGDLRHVYTFCKAMSARFKGRVLAWEPWNEANAHNFGGHTIDEMCAFQKAAYLGFKAGVPDVTVGWNPMGGINTPVLANGVLENETWPYYDTYNIHSYDWPHDYEKLWIPSREAACGRPIWVTECDRGMKADPASPCGDYTHEDALRKAGFVVQSYATSLFAGATRHFHFILGHYMEGEATVQFGLLRPDLTPRPSYVALAAVGRLLAGARCLGRWRLEGAPDAHVYAFHARPDGIARDVLVAWTEQRADWPERGTARVAWEPPLGLEVAHVYDYLGRSLGDTVPPELTSQPVFVLTAPGDADRLPLDTVPLPPWREGAVSPVVLQLDMPGRRAVMRKEAWTQEHERTAELRADTALVIAAYNFGDTPVHGTVVLEQAPEGWRIEPDRWDLDLEPMARLDLPAKLSVPETVSETDTGHWVTFRGEFGAANRPVLAFRVLALHSTDDTES